MKAITCLRRKICGEFKKKIVRLKLEECQSNPEAQKDFDSMKEILRLKKELEEVKKENLFLKKQRHSLRRKSIDGLSVYSKISRHIRSQMAFTPFQYLPQCLYNYLKI